MGLDKIKVMSNHGNLETLATVGVQLLTLLSMHKQDHYTALCMPKRPMGMFSDHYIQLFIYHDRAVKHTNA
jgi:hypothetical protein